MQVAGIALSFVLVGAASAQCYTHFNLMASPRDSLSMSMSLPLAGTFIGNYDEVNNPTGTKTKLSLFSSTNTPISYSATITPNTTIDFPQKEPVFVFCMQDDGQGGAIVDCGALDLIRGSPAPLTIDLTITYQTFYTSQPTSVFPGVSNFTLPLPAGEISAVNAVQTAPAIGVITPGEGGSLIVSAILPMDIIFEATVLGQVISGDPTPIMLPMSAQLQPSLKGDYYALVALDIPSTEVALPIAGQVIENQPFDLPTLLPPGNTAHLLVSGTFSDGTLTFALGANLSGPGVTQSDAPDFNCDGVVDGDDLGTLLGEWGDCPGCEADLNDDGVVDGDDLGALLGEWTA